MIGRFSGILLLIMTLMIITSAPLYSQEATSVLVVYGYAHDENGMPVSDEYYIVVTNMSTGVSVQTEVGTGINSGRYSVVFVDVSGGYAATEGELIRVEAMEKNGTDVFICREHVLTSVEIEEGEVFLEDIVDSEDASWGAVKCMYRND